MATSSSDPISGRIDTRYQLNAIDYVEAQRAHQRGSRGYRVLLSIGAVLLIIGALEIYKLGFAKAGPFVLLGLLWILCPFLFFRLRVRRDFEEHPNLSKEYLFQADETGIRLTSDLSEVGGKWAVYIKFRETNNLFMLYTGARMFLMIPKRAFTGEQLDRFRNLVTRNIASR